MERTVCHRRLSKHHNSFVLTIPRIMVEKYLGVSEGHSINIHGYGNKVVLIADNKPGLREDIDKYEKALDKMMEDAGKGDSKPDVGKDTHSKATALEKLSIK